MRNKQRRRRPYNNNITKKATISNAYYTYSGYQPLGKSDAPVVGAGSVKPSSRSTLLTIPTPSTTIFEISSATLTVAAAAPLETEQGTLENAALHSNGTSNEGTTSSAINSGIDHGTLEDVTRQSDSRFDSADTSPMATDSGSDDGKQPLDGKQQPDSTFDWNNAAPTPFNSGATSVDSNISPVFQTTSPTSVTWTAAAPTATNPDVIQRKSPNATLMGLSTEGFIGLLSAMAILIFVGTVLLAIFLKKRRSLRKQQNLADLVIASSLREFNPPSRESGQHVRLSLYASRVLDQK